MTATLEANGVAQVAETPAVETQLVEIDVKNVEQYSLLGVMAAKFAKQKASDVNAEVQIRFYQVSEECDLYEEIYLLSETYPNAKFSIKRDGTRERWGMKGGRPKKSDSE